MGMKKILLILAACICLTVLCRESVPVLAAESVLTEEQRVRNEEKVSMEKTRIYDYAGLIAEDDEEVLEIIYYAWGTDAQIDIILVTTDDMEGKSDKTYLEDFQDELYFTQDILAENASVMLINMEERIVTIQGYGDCEFWINNDRTEYILDWVYQDLSRGDYAAAAETFAEQAAYYMKQNAGVSTEYQPGQDYGESYGGKTEYYSKPLKEQYTVWEYLGMTMSEMLFGALLLGAIGSTVACLIIASGRKAKVTVYHATYADQNNSGLTVSRDDYLHTTVTRIRRPQSSSSSGHGGSHGGRSSGGGGRSSGGRSHSGGSRRF